MYKELLALLPRYAWKTMAEIPGRKLLSRHLASAYKDVAERTLEVKNPRIAKGKGRNNREWDGAALKVGIAILSTQLASEAIRVLGPRQRRMSVALETKVDKSCGAAKPRSRVLDVSHDENGVLCRQRSSRGYTPSHRATFEQIDGSSSDRRILDSAKTCNSHVGSGGKRRCSSVGKSEHLVESWMLASIPPRKCHCLCVEVRSAAGTRTQPKENRRVLSLVLLFFVVGSKGGVEILEMRTSCGSLLARAACARPPTRAIMKLRSTFRTGAALRATRTSHAARQPASSPFCALGRPEPQQQPKPRSSKVPQWKSDFPNFRCFLIVIYPYVSARFVAWMARV